EEQNEGLMKKYQLNRKDFQQKYGDHLSLLKIFSKYRELRSDDNKMYEFCYKHFLKQDKLDKAYKSYQKINNNIRQVATSSKIPEFNELMNLKLEYKILLAIAFGFRIHIKNLNAIKSN